MDESSSDADSVGGVCGNAGDNCGEVTAEVTELDVDIGVCCGSEGAGCGGRIDESVKWPRVLAVLERRVGIDVEMVMGRMMPVGLGRHDEVTVSEVSLLDSGAATAVEGS